MNFNGFYRSIQNSWVKRLDKKPLMPDEKLAILGYGKVMKPFYINYGNKLTKAKIDNIDFTHSEYMYGSTTANYVSDILSNGKGGNDSGF